MEEEGVLCFFFVVFLLPPAFLPPRFSSSLPLPPPTPTFDSFRSPLSADRGRWRSAKCELRTVVGLCWGNCVVVSGWYWPGSNPDWKSANMSTKTGLLRDSTFPRGSLVKCVVGRLKTNCRQRFFQFCFVLLFVFFSLNQIVHLQPGHAPCPRCINTDSKRKTEEGGGGYNQYACQSVFVWER